MSHPIHLIANAHLDPVWLWRWQEGCNEALQTFRSALDRLAETPGFIFTCSSAAYYQWVEEMDPAMFGEIRQAVRAGRWVPVNGWWVQPDCNLPSGESFARQALLGQLYYREKFGVTCKTGYNVDSFGHNAMLPQLLKRGGMDSYVMMRPDPGENPEIPENVFWWESPDGSRVATYRLPTAYTCEGEDTLEYLAECLTERADEVGHGMMLFYGVGNHGGGPAKADINFLTELMQGDAYGHLVFSSPDAFFSALCAEKLALPVWKGDLQHHASGCYSVTSMIKQLNRKAEQELYFAEAFSCVAGRLCEIARDEETEDTKQFREAWRDVAFNQFHDILAGCCIPEAYEDARDSYGHARTIAARLANQALLRISRNIDTWVEGVDEPTKEVRHRGIPLKFPRPVVVFNALSYAREVPVQITERSGWVENAAHALVPSQNVTPSRFDNAGAKDTLFLAKLPPLGCALYWLYLGDRGQESGIRGCEADGSEASGLYLPEEACPGSGEVEYIDAVIIQNEFLWVKFCPRTGGIAQLYDITNDREVNHSTLLVPTVINDIKSDTWAHGVFKFHDIQGQMELESIRLLEHGPLRAAVQVKHRYGNSTLLQTFTLASKQRSLQVEAKILWQEPFTLLKLPLPLAGADAVSTYEIPAGFLKRPCDGGEEPAQNWADLTVTDEEGRRHGVAFMSDAKYSYDCPETGCSDQESGTRETALRLTALRNCVYADHCGSRPDREFSFTDEGLQKFTYAIYPHEGEAEQSGVTREALALNNPPRAVQESYHAGTLPGEMSFLQIDRPNIIATAYKPCEDGSGDLVLRCCETQGRDTHAHIAVPQAGAAFDCRFGRHEIKTFRMDGAGNAREVDFLEGIA